MAVGNRDAKLATLLELLHALRAASTRPVAVCCSSRDSLDAVVHALLHSHAFCVTAIHSDLTEQERELALSSFRRAALPAASGVEARDRAESGSGSGASGGPASKVGGSGQGGVGRAGGAAGEEAAGRGPQAQAHPQEEQQETYVLALTDVCLKALPRELLPVGLSLLIEYELPSSKEMYLRRLSALVGGGKDRRSGRCCVVDMVEAGQAAAFRALEGFAAAPVLEMPVRVVDIFA